MKLRIKGNSIRLRLTQAEVQRIAKRETVQDHLRFGRDTPPFTYALEVGPKASEITASYQAYSLLVTLPSEVARQWAESNQISLEETLSLDEDASLYVLVEKDFQCLHQRPNEDERDHFPNPAATTNQ